MRWAWAASPRSPRRLPGYSSVRPDTAAPLAEILRLNGYSTAQFGKCHEVPVWETSPMGPFTQWPTGSGFEYFYGFVGAETNQWYPALYEGTTPVEPPKTPEEGYHFTEDMTDQAITWVRQQKSLMPDKPFFMYFAPGATHAPHHVPPSGATSTKGAFDAGWDALRERDPGPPEGSWASSRPTPSCHARPAEIQAWDDVADDLKPVLARQMEVYAGFMEHTDHHIGRLVDTLEELGVLDDTLDLPDHRRQRGQRRGHAQRHVQRDHLAQRGGRVRDHRVHGRSHRRVRERRPPTTTTRWVGPTPWTPPTSGPSRWPRTSAAPATAPSSTGPTASRPGARSAASSTTSSTSPPPSSTSAGLARADVRQRHPADAAARRVAWPTPSTTPTRPRPRETQYFEVACNRGIYHKGWTAVTRHSVPWDFGAELPALDDDVWELYDTNTDWSQAHDLAAEHPEKLAGAAAALADRGGQVQRAAARRPAHRAVQLRHRRATRC